MIQLINTHCPADPKATEVAYSSLENSNIPNCFSFGIMKGIWVQI